MHVPAMQVADGDASDSDASGVGKWFFLGALKHLKFSKSALRAARYAGALRANTGARYARATTSPRYARATTSPRYARATTNPRYAR